MAGRSGNSTGLISEYWINPLGDQEMNAAEPPENLEKTENRLFERANFFGIITQKIYVLTLAQSGDSW
jgi:hypothetical protein